MVLKKIQDYYEEIFKLYPEVNKNDIKIILQYGWKSLLLHNKHGGDTIIKRNGFWFYCGQLFKDSIKYFNYYKLKTIIKLRIMYKRKKVKWDGYYYFSRTSSQYQKYLNQKNKKGRPKKTFEFENVKCYKIFDECNISESGSVAIFRLKQPIQHGYVLFFKNLKTKDAELVLERDPLTLKDILSQNYDYEFLNK